MPGKITALRISHQGRRASVRALAKTGRGTQYTLRSVELGAVSGGLAGVKDAIANAVYEILTEQPE